MPPGTYSVEYGEDSRPWKAPPPEPDQAEYCKPEVQAQGRDYIERMLAQEPSAGAAIAGGRR